jgi:hypothetical protein
MEGITSPLGDKIHPWGRSSPLGSKFAPRCEVKNGPQVFLTTMVKNGTINVLQALKMYFQYNIKFTNQRFAFALAAWHGATVTATASESEDRGFES